jgi:hypothetical protein
MKRHMSLLILVLLLFLSNLAYADDMGSYCSAPPFVTRTVPPNIMILMDNSQGMKDDSYKNLAYNPNKPYEGYFKSDLKYSYSSNRFVPDSAGSFSGNLLNWATTSRYDLLQKILVGGKSASRISNINTLKSESSSWEKKYNGCVFKVSGDAVQITDDPAAGANSCGLLDTPPLWLASSEIGVTVYHSYSGMKSFLSGFMRLLRHAPEKVGTAIAKVFDYLSSSAYAVKPLTVSTHSLQDAVKNNAYSAPLTADGGSGSETGYTWSVIGSLPAGLVLNSANTSQTTITGNPTAAIGPYSFTIQVSNSSGKQPAKHLP